MKKLPNTQRLVNRLKFGIGSTKINPDIRKLTFEYRTRDPAPTVRFLEKALPRLQFHNPGVSFEVFRHTPVKFKPIRERKPREEQTASTEAETSATEGAEKTVAEVTEQPKTEPAKPTTTEVTEKAVKKPSETEKTTTTPIEKKVRPTLKVEFANAKSITWKLKNIHSRYIIEKLVNASSESPNPKIEKVHQKVKSEAKL